MNELLLILLCFCIPFCASIVLLKRKEYHSRAEAEEIVADMGMQLRTIKHLEKSFGLSKKSAHELITDLKNDIKSELNQIPQTNSGYSELIEQMKHLECGINEYLCQLEE